jgi:hypothetical protein
VPCKNCGNYHSNDCWPPCARCGRRHRSWCTALCSHCGKRGRSGTYCRTPRNEDSRSAPEGSNPVREVTIEARLNWRDIQPEAVAQRVAAAVRQAQMPVRDRSRSPTLNAGPENYRSRSPGPGRLMWLLLVALCLPILLKRGMTSHNAGATTEATMPESGESRPERPRNCRPLRDSELGGTRQVGGRGVCRAPRRGCVMDCSGPSK